MERGAAQQPGREENDEWDVDTAVKLSSPEEAIAEYRSVLFGVGLLVFYYRHC